MLCIMFPRIKRLIATSLAVIAITGSVSLVHADTFQESFNKQSVPMLMVSTENGDLLAANPAAANFYGYSLEQLSKMNISQINTFTKEQVTNEIAKAKSQGRNYFVFRHRKADQSTTKVEVYTAPMEYRGQMAIFSIVRPAADSMETHDGYYQSQLETQVDLQTEQIREQSRMVIGSLTIGLAVTVILLAVMLWLIRHAVIARTRAEEGEARLQTIFNSISDCIVYTSEGRRILDANKSTVETFGYSVTALRGMPVENLYQNREDKERIEKLNGENTLYEADYQRRDGESFIGETQASSISLSGSDKVLGYIRVIRDITERKHTEEELRLAASVFSATSEGILIFDFNTVLVDINQAYTRISGYQREQVLGKPMQELFCDNLDTTAFDTMEKGLQKMDYWQGSLDTSRATGERCAIQLSINAVRSDAGQLLQYVAIITDITEKRRQEQQLKQIAHFDILTGLPNRLLLADRLQHGMTQALRRKQNLAVVYIDLDGFKAVNDTWGHATGDKLLIEVAQRMRHALRESDTVARLGGDEFVAVFVDLPDGIPYEVFLMRLLKAASEPVYIDGQALKVSASLGVTMYPQQEELDADQLLRQADQAMYQAKISGKGIYHIFDAQQDRDIKDRNVIIDNINQALIAEQFVLHYQPKVNMRSGEVVGAEALIRWQHPERGLLSPIKFLPYIEDHPTITKIGEWVIDQVMLQIAQWRELDIRIPISVNVSAHQLQQDDFTERLQLLLARHPNTANHWLEIEVLESSAMKDLAQVAKTIQACDQLGVGFALDDFGTGYSSLSYLKQLPVSSIKIDRSFITEMDNETEDIALLRGILGLAEIFDRRVIAEGIETVEQGEKLLELGCELAQGFGIAKPMPAEQLPNWYRQWQPPQRWREA